MASKSLLVNAGPSYRKDLVSFKIPILLLSHSSQLTASIIREKRKSDNANSIKRMNYDNYERCIVERHGFALVGWLDNLLLVRNPSRIGGVSQRVDLGQNNNPNTTPTKDYENVRVVVYLRGVQRGCAEEGERGSTPTG